VLMKRNYLEFPKLITLVHKLSGDNNFVKIEINCNSLININSDDYIEFIKNEHHTFIDKQAVILIFTEANEIAKKCKIPVVILSSYNIDDFVNKKCPLPPLETVAPKAPKVRIKKLKTSSPVLKPQDPIEPERYVFKVKDRNRVTIAPVIIVPKEKQFNKGMLFSAIVSGEDVFVACPDGPFENINWEFRKGPLERCVFRKEIPHFSEIILNKKITFKLNLDNIDTKNIHGFFDIYFGFSTSKIAPLSNFIGAGYRLAFD
jgi:hypothetical protein